MKAAHADLYPILRKLEGERPKYFVRNGESFRFLNADQLGTMRSHWSDWFDWLDVFVKIKIA